MNFNLHFFLHRSFFLGGIALCTLIIGVFFSFYTNNDYYKAEIIEPFSKNSSQEVLRKKVISFSEETEKTFPIFITSEKQIAPIVFASSQEVLRSHSFPSLSLEVISTSESTREKSSLAVKAITFQKIKENQFVPSLIFSESPPWYTEYIIHVSEESSIPLEIIP